MKVQNFILFLFIVLLNGCLSDKHLEFENVPITGNLEKFANELVKSGFSDPQVQEGKQIKLIGTFMEKNCEIFVYGAGESQTAYKVRVNLPREVRDSLEISFGKIQKQYTLKYGNGVSKYKQFQNAERFLFNEPKRTRHLNVGDFTRYVINSGEIVVEVQEGYISITFTDKLNSLKTGT